MELRITVKLDSAAFEDNPSELAEILDAIKELPTTPNAGSLYDSNGNTVGSWWVGESP